MGLGTCLHRCDPDPVPEAFPGTRLSRTASPTGSGARPAEQRSSLKNNDPNNERSGTHSLTIKRTERDRQTCI